MAKAELCGQNLTHGGMWVFFTYHVDEAELGRVDDLDAGNVNRDDDTTGWNQRV